MSLIKICLAMEEAEARASAKARALIRTYQNQFKSMVYTVHPKGIIGEVRGKASNIAWACKDLLKGCSVSDVVTIMDVDTCFAQDYFQAVSCHYAAANSENRLFMMFAPTTLFDRFIFD